jgi:hypothetical protein
LSAPELAGSFALVSILSSSATTGFASAMISFDYDIDLTHRKFQPLFYGYIPDDNGLRGRSFLLMTLISALHNLSRSVACALGEKKGFGVFTNPIIGTNPLLPNSFSGRL